MEKSLLETKRSDLLTCHSPTELLGKGKVRKFIGKIVRNSSFQLWMNDVSRKDYVNLGAGGNLLKGFINIDYSWCRDLDLCWDVTRKLPLKSNSIKGLFTEHTLEHFIWADTLGIVLPEAFRILKPGGTIRVSVPDAEKAIEEYWKAKEDGETRKPWRIPYDGSNRIPLTPMLALNNTFRRIYEPLEMGHKFAYDFQTLEYFLHQVGFVNITREIYLHGRDESLLVDYEKRSGESLYVEASKPTG